MIKKLLVNVLKLWIVFLIFCMLIPPLIHVQNDVNSELSELQSDKSLYGERVQIIDDNTEALIWRLQLIEKAEEKIELSTFEFWDDQAGLDIMTALDNAAKRGVHVQIIVDGMSGFFNLEFSGNFRELAENPNVEVKLYNPINLFKPWKINYRMHDKYMIIDNLAYILGGRNISNLFLGEYGSKSNEDRDVLVYNASGSENSIIQLSTYFSDMWENPCCKSYLGYGHSKSKLEEKYDDLRKRFPLAFQEINWQKDTYSTRQVTVLFGESCASNKPQNVWKKIIDYIQQADEATIVTPYIICDRSMYLDLEKVIEDGTKVNVITNAPGNGANPFGCADYLNEKQKLLRYGINLNEYVGERSLHTKTILIDNSTSIIGSFNIDMRSAYLDTELMLVIESEEVNRQLQDYMDVMRKRSIQYSPEGTQYSGELYSSPNISIVRKIGYCVFQILIIPIRHLL